MALTSCLKTGVPMSPTTGFNRSGSLVKSDSGFAVPTKLQSIRISERGRERLRIQAVFSFPPAFLTRNGRAEKQKQLKQDLLEAIEPLERGATASPEDQLRIDQLARKVEAVNPTKEPLKSDLINGKWELIYTTSASILQAKKPRFLRSITNYQSINVDTLKVQNMETWPFYNSKRVQDSLLDKMRMQLIARGLNQSIIVVGEFKMKHKWRDKRIQPVFEFELILNSVVITTGVEICCDYMGKVMAAIVLFQGLVVQPKQKQMKAFKIWAFKYNHKIQEPKWDITMTHIILTKQTSLWFRLQVHLQQMNLHEFSKSKLCDYNTRRRRLQSLELATWRVPWKKQSIYVLLQFFSLQKLGDKLSSNGGVLICHEEYSGEVKTTLFVIVKRVGISELQQKKLD